MYVTFGTPLSPLSRIKEINRKSYNIVVYMQRKIEAESLKNFITCYQMGNRGKVTCTYLGKIIMFWGQLFILVD